MSGIELLGALATALAAGLGALIGKTAYGHRRAASSAGGERQELLAYLASAEVRRVLEEVPSAAESGQEDARRGQSLAVLATLREKLSRLPAAQYDAGTRTQVQNTLRRVE